MKLNTWEVSGFSGAIRGMREPFKSWDKSDSGFPRFTPEEMNKLKDSSIPLYYTSGSSAANSNAIGNFYIGANDMKLAHNLLSSGSDSDSKFLRMIHVQVEIESPAYFLAELDTYKIDTTRNSSSLQHIGSKRDYCLSDFELDNDFDKEQLLNSLEEINDLRTKYIETKDYKYFRAMRQRIPQSYLYTIMYDCNYQTLRNIYNQRILHPHRLIEWTEYFSNWINTLPYSDELIKYGTSSIQTYED